MAKNWWFKFDWDDWLNDEDLSACSLETQGLWLRCICLMYRSDTAELTGSLEQLRRKLGVLPEELTRCLHDLKSNNAANVRFGNGDVSILSRRRQREVKAKENNRLYVAKHREKAECKVDVRTQSKSKSLKKEKEEELRDVSLAKPTPKKGTRLPDSFFLTAEMRSWAADRKPDVDLILETEKFCNYFRSAAGQKGVKLNWELTWRNWVLNANGTNKSNYRNGKRTDQDVLRESAEFYANWDANNGLAS